MTATARAGQAATVALLAVAVIAWAALPLAGADAGSPPVLAAAVICAAASLTRLAIGDAQIGSGAFDPPLVRIAAYVAYASRSLPWSEGMIIAVLGLEALHHSRPWHTGVLGAAMLAYVLAAHLAETRARPAALRAQLPVIAAGLGLLVLAVAAAALPQARAGAATELLRALAVTAAVIAAGLALPTLARRRHGADDRDRLTGQGGG